MTESNKNPSAVTLKSVFEVLYKPNPVINRHIKPKWLRMTLYILGYICAVIVPLTAYVSAEYISYGVVDRLYGLVSNHLTRVMLSVTVLYAVYIVLWFFCRRAWIASAIMLFFSDVLAIASYLKFGATGENLYPWDLQQASNVGLLTDYVKISLPAKSYFIIFVGLLIVVFLFITKPAIPLKWYVRIPAAIIISLVLVLNYNTTAKLSALLEKHDMTFQDAALQESNYRANGFCGAFILNCFSGVIDEPDGYTEENVVSILDSYEESPASEDFKNPNIILILCESFWDVTQLQDCDFSEDPLSVYREICSRDNVYSGSFYTTGFGGGTVRPEFEVLTGLTTDYLPSGSIPWQYVDDDFPTYASVMKEQFGYSTTMLHPYLPNFYMRKTKYPLLGFDATWFDDDLRSIKQVVRTGGGGQVSDSAVMEYIQYFLENSEERDFIFAISMEGHQPYSDRFTEDELSVKVSCDGMDEDILYLVNQYTQCAYDMDKAIGELIDYVDSFDEETVVVLFGDHAPTLGTNYAAYYQSDTISDSNINTYEKRSITYSTPFLVYANFELDGDNGMLEEGSGNKIASYNLMNAVYRMIGAPVTRQMEFLYDFHQAAPDYNNRTNVPMTDEISYFAKSHMLLTYDLLRGKQYAAGIGE